MAAIARSAVALGVMQDLGVNGRIVGGSIKFKGRELNTMTREELRDIRGSEIAMIYQEPMASLNPAMRIGKQMQFFGARANLAKMLLYAINGGRDELIGAQVGPEMPVLPDRELDYDEVMQRLDVYMAWLARTYINALNIIHYMHDKYAYERIEMALHDSAPARTLACGIAGLSVLADSLSAIKYATVRPIRDDIRAHVEALLEELVPAGTT